MLHDTAVPAVITSAATTLDHLSWSGLKTYFDCPAKFKFRYIEQAEPECVPASLAFGHAFHRVFEEVQQARLQGDALPAEDVLMDAFTFGWREETEEAPPVIYAQKEGPCELHELARRMIPALLQHERQNQGGCIISIEEEVRFRLAPELPAIEMRPDLVEVRGDDLVITDFKTSRSAWNDTKVQEQLPQLVLYSYGLIGLYRDLEATKIVPRFLVVTKAKTPKVQVFEPKATRDDAQKLKHRVLDAWAAMQAGVFVAHESWQCKQCQYQQHCRSGSTCPI